MMMSLRCVSVLRSSSPHSAVCVFRLQDVRAAFAGSYRTYNMETQQWSPLQGNHPHLGKVRGRGLGVRGHLVVYSY